MVVGMGSGALCLLSKGSTKDLLASILLYIFLIYLFIYRYMYFHRFIFCILILPSSPPPLNTPRTTVSFPSQIPILILHHLVFNTLDSISAAQTCIWKWYLPMATVPKKSDSLWSQIPIAPKLMARVWLFLFIPCQSFNWLDLVQVFCCWKQLLCAHMCNGHALSGGKHFTAYLSISLVLSVFLLFYVVPWSLEVIRIYLFLMENFIL